MQQFISAMGEEIKAVIPARMLHAGIAKACAEKKTTALAQEEVTVVAEAESAAGEHCGPATIATVHANVFLQNVALHQEVFGPYALIVRCQDLHEMLEVARQLEGS